jgi:hypothetical protein
MIKSGRMPSQGISRKSEIPFFFASDVIIKKAVAAVQASTNSTMRSTVQFALFQKCV